MFVIIYQPSDEPIKVVYNQANNESNLIGKWRVDTDEEGNVSTYEDLAEALERTLDIRKKGGEACLAVVIE